MTSSLRISTDVERPDAVRIFVNGRAVQAVPGESVVAALLACGIRDMRPSRRRHHPRGAFCMTGVCQECTITIDGRPAQACLEPVREDLSIELSMAGDDL